MDQKHVAIASAGASAVRDWRDRHPGLVLDLSYASLANADLRSVDLQECNLFRADLFGARCEGASFRGADLRMAYISETDLTGADLRNANLWGADLSMDAMVGGTCLRDADLTGAQLGDALFRGSTLVGTVLDAADLRGCLFADSDLTGLSCEGASVGRTTFANVDLSTVLGLATVRHAEPSSLSLDTVFRSKGRIPDAFLRGCGYDPRVQALLLGDAGPHGSATGEGPTLRLQSCFISYSTKDKRFGDRLKEALNRAGVDYWYAPEHGEWGQPLTDQIERQIKQRDRVLLVCSRHSLDDSQWVQWELETALKHERARRTRMLFPIMIDDALLEWNHPTGTALRAILAGDFRHALEGKAFDACLTKLVASLRNPSIAGERP